MVRLSMRAMVVPLTNAVNHPIELPRPSVGFVRRRSTANLADGNASPVFYAVKMAPVMISSWGQ